MNKKILALACSVAAFIVAFSASAQTIIVPQRFAPEMMFPQRVSPEMMFPQRVSPEMMFLPPSAPEDDPLSEFERAISEFARQHPGASASAIDGLLDAGANIFEAGCGLVIGLGCNQGSISHGAFQEQAGEKMRCKCIGVRSGCRWVFASEWN